MRMERQFCVSFVAVCASVALAVGCGNDESAEHEGTGGAAQGGNGGAGATSTEGGAGGEGGAWCDIPELSADLPDDLGVPFVAWAGPLSDGGATATTTFPDAGRVCLEGTKPAGAFAQMTMAVATVGERNVVTLRDFDALGIVAVRFVLETPPAGGIRFVLVNSDPVDCYSDNVSKFLYTHAAGSVLTDAGTVTVSLTELEFESGDGSTTFDPTRMLSMDFVLAAAGDFDFCISGVEFLDADGNPVSP